jgi:hypothetical protein
MCVFGTIKKCYVKMTIRRVDDQVTVNRAVIKAKPTVLVFLHTHALHLEIYPQQPSLTGQRLVMLLDEHLCRLLLFEL